MLALLASMLVGWIIVVRQGSAPQRGAGADDVRSLIPSDAFLVAVVDVAALRATEVGKRFLGQGRSVAGLGEIGKLCGSDPMDAVDQLAIAVPAGDSDGFGFFAQGGFDPGAMLRCAERIVVKRGGRPVRRDLAGHAAMHDGSAKAGPTLAVAHDGAWVALGEPDYVQHGGKGKTVDDNAAHAVLIDRVPDGVVVATVVFSDAHRKSLEEELRLQRQTDSPLGSLIAAAMSVRLGAQLDIDVALRCDDAADCKAVASLIDEKRREESLTPAAIAIGIASVLGNMKIASQGDTAQLHVSLSIEEAFQLVQRLIALRKLGSQLPPPRPSPLPSSNQTAEPLDEDAGVRIDAKPDGG